MDRQETEALEKLVEESRRELEIMRELARESARRLGMESSTPEEAVASIEKRERAETEAIAAFARLRSVSVLSTCFFIGTAIVFVATYTYFSVRDAIPGNPVIGILLLIGVLSGLGALLYGITQANLVRQLAHHPELFGIFDDDDDDGSASLSRPISEGTYRLVKKQTPQKSHYQQFSSHPAAKRWIVRRNG